MPRQDRRGGHFQGLPSCAGLRGCSWPLNQLQAVAGRIDRDSYDHASVSERTRVGGHRAARGLDGGDRRGYGSYRFSSSKSPGACLSSPTTAAMKAAVVV